MKPEDVTPELLLWLKNNAEQAEGFIEREAPLLAQEILFWHWLNHVGGLLFVGCIVTALLYGSYRCFREQRREGREEEFPFVFTGYVLLVVAFFLAALVIAFDGLEIVKVYQAPRLVIIEHVKGLL